MHTKKLLRFLFMMIPTVLATGTAGAITLTASPNPAIVNEAVTFTIAISTDSPPCNVYISFGDSRSNTLVGTATQIDSTFQITHTYTQTGVYTVSAFDDTMIAEPPNPVTMTLQVAAPSNPVTPPTPEPEPSIPGLEIKRLETLFDTGKPQVTLQRNQPAPELSTIISYSGSGYIRGYWEVDGNREQYFFKQLSIGPQEVISYPKIPGLSTYQPGSHVVRFVITKPAMDIDFPKVVYYVTEQAYITETEIEILTPGSGEALPFQPMTFSWQSIPKTEVYMVHIFSEEEQPIFSAYSAKNSYELRKEILDRFLKPDHRYYVEVQGFHEDTRVTGKSKLMPLTFGK